MIHRDEKLELVSPQPVQSSELKMAVRRTVLLAEDAVFMGFKSSVQSGGIVHAWSPSPSLPSTPPG